MLMLAFNFKNMKNIITYKKRFLALVMSVLLVSSCSESFLDLTPYDALDSESALLTDNDLYVALIGAYAGLYNENLYGRAIPIIAEIQADNVLISTVNSGRHTTIYQNTFVVNSADYEDLWQNAYEVINRVNNVINAELETVTDQTAVDQYKGEAYAIRALLYFDLVRIYAAPYSENPEGLGVPIVTVSDVEQLPARASIEEVYAQIIADLTQAESLLTTTTNTGQFSLYAAKALRARVYLTQENYQEAFDEAVDVINSSGVSLVTGANYAAYWQTSAAQALGTETLFEVISTQVNNAGFEELAYFYSQVGYGDALAQASLYNLYNDSDVRKALITPGVRAGGENPAYIAEKYWDLTNYGGKRILRISELYLTAAEAAYNLGNESDAITWLQSLVAERDAENPVVETGAALLERIITERRKELAFEGDRIHTLNRLQRDVVDRGTAVDILYADFRRVAPIPQRETDINANLEQNPGY